MRVKAITQLIIEYALRFYIEIYYVIRIVSVIKFFISWRSD